LGSHQRVNQMLLKIKFTGRRFQFIPLTYKHESVHAVSHQEIHSVSDSLETGHGIFVRGKEWGNQHVDSFARGGARRHRSLSGYCNERMHVGAFLPALRN
jgi:hypothetical protein